METAARLAAWTVATTVAVAAAWPDGHGSDSPHAQAPAASVAQGNARPAGNTPAGPAADRSGMPPGPPALPPSIIATPAAPAGPAQPPAVPYAYVGSWSEGKLLHLQLKRQGTTMQVDGLGRVDDDYVVVAADSDRVSLKYLPLGTVHVIRREMLPPMQRPAPQQVHTPAANNSEPQSEN